MKKFLLAAMAFCSITAGAWAQDESKEAIGQASEASQSFQLAASLSTYGYANKSALPLIQAAQIVKESGMKETQEKTEDSGTAKQSDQKKGEISLDVTKLLADAKKFAAGDKTLLALIDKVNSSATRGSTVGVEYITHNIPANGYSWITRTFYANSFCEAAVKGDGDTDLDLYIYDENGNLIARSVSYSDREYVSWRPSWTGTFKIKVVNRGNVYNHAVIGHN